MIASILYWLVDINYLKKMNYGVTHLKTNITGAVFLKKNSILELFTYLECRCQTKVDTNKSQNPLSNLYWVRVL